MATKKQKRAAAEARREQFMENDRLLGLKAQQEDHARRQRSAASLKKVSEEENAQLQRILDAHNAAETTAKSPGSEGLHDVLQLLTDHFGHQPSAALVEEFIFGDEETRTIIWNQGASQ